jgi:hypothetical protein
VNWLLSAAVAGAIVVLPGGGGGTPARPDSPTGANLTVTASYSPVMVVAPQTYNWVITITNDLAEVIPGLELSIALPSHLSLAAAHAPASDNTCGGTLALTAPGSVELSSGATLGSGICSFVIVVQADQVGSYSFSTGAPLNSVSGSPGTPATISVTVDAPSCSAPTLSPTPTATVIAPGLAVGSGVQPAAQGTPCASPPPTSTAGTGSSSDSGPMLALLVAFAFGGLGIAAVWTKRRRAIR